MGRLAIAAVAGLFATAALNAQAAATPERDWQISGGLGLGNTTVAVAGPASGTPNKSMGGRAQVGAGINPWTVVGLDVYWSNISDHVNLVPAPAGRDAFMSAALIAKLYPVRRGPFVELGLGYAQGELGSGYAAMSVRGFGIRYGTGVDIATSDKETWSVTLYAAGLLLVQPQSSDTYSAPACIAPAGSGCLDVMHSIAVRSDVAGYGPNALNSVNILHFGVALTYAGHSARGPKP